MFCHGSGFLGGAVSLESAIKMAQLSIEAKEWEIIKKKIKNFK